MFTNEFEFDTTIITVLDDSGREEDVVVEMADEHVDIRQFNPNLEKYDLITLTPKMMAELIEAFRHPEGFYHTKFSRDPQK